MIIAEKGYRVKSNKKGRTKARPKITLPPTNYVYIALSLLTNLGAAPTPEMHISKHGWNNEHDRDYR